VPLPSPVHVAVIGGGPAGLMAAEVLAAGGVRVTVYDRMPSVGRKFLLAGRGGLNLTHSEDMAPLLLRYGAAAPHLRAAIAAFPPTRLRAWCEGLGQQTFIGSSGRVFPTGMKASPLLRAWLHRLAEANVEFKLRHHWRGWDEGGRLLFAAPQGAVCVSPSATVLAMGGASWPRLGSQGDWTQVLCAAGIAVCPLRPANCGFIVAWSQTFRQRFAGQPLKRLALSFGGAHARGEAVITATGLEGGGVYALSAPLRDAIAATGQAILYIDLRPDSSVGELARRLATPHAKQSLATVLRKAARLSPPAIALLREVAVVARRRGEAVDALSLAAIIKALPLVLTGVAPIARAISSAGGVAFCQITEDFMLRARPGVFVAGEMLDWEAPTGGYLLQACLATGAGAGHGALGWLASPAKVAHGLS
jgi:uncharacterized flavoprotein (TIGR03862 family)